MNNRVELMIDSTYNYGYAVKRYISHRNKYRFFCFFEGQDDISFYNPILTSQLGFDTFLPIITGCKNTVIRLHNEPELFSELDCPIFFIDKDFSYWNNTQLSSKKLYVTDGYSIENFLIKQDILKSILFENYLLSQVSTDELNHFLNSFNSLIFDFSENFKRNFAILILLSRKNRNFHCNSVIDFKINDFTLLMESDMKFRLNISTSKLEEFELLIVKNGISNDDLIKVIDEINNTPNEYHIRGKWLLLLLIKFAEYVKHNYKSIFKSLTHFNINSGFELTKNNAVGILSAKLVLNPPQTLSDFLSYHKENILQNN